MALGLASVVCSATGEFTIAAWMVLWGVLLDKLDGGAARMLNASSAFGAEMDSFADFVSFGIAPAALVYFRLTSAGLFAEYSVVLMGCCTLYTIALSVRLARFNVSEPPGGKRFFFGIPSTLCGAMVASGFLTAEKYGAPSGVWTAIPLVMAAMGVLMVSNVRVPKFHLNWSKPVNLFQIVNMGIAYVFAPLMIFPEYLLFQSSGYMVVGAIYAAIHPLDETDLPLEESVRTN
jgi:CDP-diacylglycerol--serine O-phosphatidyltransferase